MIVSEGNKLEISLPEEVKFTSDEIVTLEEAERQHIVRALELTGWRVSGGKGAAKILNINHKTLFSRMKKLGIQRKS